MKTKHANLGCSHTKFSHWGHRRRRCLDCGITWRTRIKKRGRKQRRANLVSFKKYLQTGQRPRLTGGREVIRRHLATSRDLFCRQTAWPKLPTGPLILIADAMICRVAKTHWTCYFCLVRSTTDHIAIILPPHWVLGYETIKGWQQALGQLNQTLDKQIVAVVCDGHRGLVNYAKWSNWTIQRCHFHLLAFLAGRRSWGQRSRHRQEGVQLLKLAQQALTTPIETDLTALLSLIEAYAWETKSTQLKKALSGFVTNIASYRTYLKYPEWYLPTTSNSAEAYIGLARSFLRRLRGIRTIEAIQKWIETHCKSRPTIKCLPARPNPKNKYQPN